MLDQWITRTEERPQARLRLLCFPPAGGTSSLYRNWAKRFPEDVELASLELPGRERRFREPAIDRMDQLLPQLLDLMQELDDRPFVFFGHSMGAVIAFHLTYALREAGRSLPELLILSGRKAPQTPERFPLLYNLSDGDFREGLAAYGGTPKEVLADEELMEIFVPLLRADFSLFETHAYVPRPPLPVPFLVLGGREDPRAIQGELQAWRIHTSADFDLKILPGGHFFLRDYEAETTRTVLEALQSRTLV